MLISKFNLYTSEWLERVFDNRNKEYGAYYLRQHYADNVVKAMGITFLSIGLVIGGSIIFSNTPQTRTIVVNLPPIAPSLPPPLPPVKRVDPPAPPRSLRAQPLAPAVATQRVLPPVVVPDPVAEKPITNIDIKNAIGPNNLDGIKTPGNGPVAATPEGGGGGTPTDDKTIYSTNGLDVMPEPVGGSAAWAKFLNKNLRFPYEAQTDGVSGRVSLSFIIEKDGHLSNISISRAAGHGFDEEAMRVLKMAKAWKPGMQNGQPVRVKYEIPINFQLATGD